MKKRSIALILAASLAALTGCGGAGSTAATTAASTTAAQSAGADEAAANVKATPIEGAPEQTDIDAAKGDNYGFPKGTITWVVPGKAGGGSDLAIRYLATTMQQDRKYCFDAWTVGVFLTLLLCDHTGCCTFQGLHLEGHHGSRHRSSAWFCRSRSDHGCCTLYLR